MDEEPNRDAWQPEFRELCETRGCGELEIEAIMSGYLLWLQSDPSVAQEVKQSKQAATRSFSRYFKAWTLISDDFHGGTFIIPRPSLIHKVFEEFGINNLSEYEIYKIFELFCVEILPLVASKTRTKGTCTRLLRQCVAGYTVAHDWELIMPVIDRVSRKVFTWQGFRRLSTEDIENLRGKLIDSIRRSMNNESSSYKGEKQIENWVSVIAKRRFEDYLRERKRTPTMTSTDDSSKRIDIVDDTIETNPEIYSLRNVCAQCFAEKIGQLTDKQRTAIEMHYYEELSFKEIAEMLNLNYEAVKKNAQDGVKKLRELLNDCAEVCGLRNGRKIKI